MEVPALERVAERTRHALLHEQPLPLRGRLRRQGAGALLPGAEQGAAVQQGAALAELSSGAISL